MGITGLMYSGLTGLTATGRSIAVTGDNIANLNTIGYRGSRAIFEDVLNRSIVGVGELGGGSRVAQIEKLFHQGAIVPSPRPEDMAIDGRGFFAVRGVHNGVMDTYFTRAGRFDVDLDGYLAAGNLRVQGYPANGSGIGTQLGDLRIERAVSPRATQQITMEVTFDGSQLQGPAVPFDVNNPEETSVRSQEVTLYDSRGTPISGTVYFTRTNQDTWEWNMLADGGEVVGGTAGTPTIIASGGIEFDTDGNFVQQTGPANTVDFVGATAGQTIALDFSRSSNAALSGANDPDATNVVAFDQDGYGPGDYLNLSVQEDGTLIGYYDNGQEVTVGRIALANFANQAGLARQGGSLFTATAASGEPAIGFAGTGGRGGLRDSSLEQSNVDLSEEFVRLITDQRGYQAQSRTITTADELLSETVNLKR